MSQPDSALIEASRGDLIILRSGLNWAIDLKIRPANPGDCLVIAEFNQRLAEETENLRLDPARIGPGVVELLRDPGKGVYYMAELGGTVVGQVMITYEWSDWRNATIWWLQSVYVRPEFRRRGIFRALFQYVTGLARTRPDVCGLRLYMHEANQVARRSYECLGMKRTQYEVLELELGDSDHLASKRPRTA